MVVSIFWTIIWLLILALENPFRCVRFSSPNWTRDSSFSHLYVEVPFLTPARTPWILNLPVEFPCICSPAYEFNGMSPSYDICSLLVYACFLTEEIIVHSERYLQWSVVHQFSLDFYYCFVLIVCTHFHAVGPTGIVWTFVRTFIVVDGFVLRCALEWVREARVIGHSCFIELIPRLR